MPTFEVNGKSYLVDEDGFLEDPKIWNTEVAADFAMSEGVTELTDDHWKVIQLPQELLSRVRHCAHDPEAVQGNRFQVEPDL